jgi:hypothetical protein
MMGGSIDVRSRLGSGTTVQVSLPLMRPPAGSESAQSTPRSSSTSATRDASVELLRDDTTGYAVAIHEYFHIKQTLDRSREYAKVLARYVTEWYGITMCDWDDRCSANVWIIEERDMPEVLHGGAESVPEQKPALIVLCSNATRHSQAEAEKAESQREGIFEHISKPCGPHKLARALRSCLERMQLLKSVHAPQIQVSLHSTASEGFQRLDLPPIHKDDVPIPIQANETLSASQTTRNAQMAIKHCSAGSKHDGDKFPFPSERTFSITSPLSPEVQNLSKWTQATGDMSPLARSGDAGPRMLLVDDNKINLQLLQTFMHKQKYKFVDSAEDGNVAVNAVKDAEKPYDIIFMGKQQTQRSKFFNDQRLCSLLTLTFCRHFNAGDERFRSDSFNPYLRGGAPIQACHDHRPDRPSE